MKKILSALLACSILLAATCTGVFGAAEFPDLQGAQWDWARGTIMSLADQQIIKGYSDGTFKPDNNVTNEEAFTLFARSVGVENKLNEGALEAAISRYSGVASTYNTFASKELCYMLYRSMFIPSELDKYLSADRKSTPMLRHEAAILITRIMGGEQDVKNKVSYVMDYTDIAKIPPASLGYVEYVKDRGIMLGVGDGSFSPMSNLTRAQICVILKRAMDAMALDFIPGKINSTDVSGKSISFTADGGEASLYTVAADAMFNIDGKSVKLEDLKPNMDAVLTISVKGVWAVDAKTTAAAPLVPDKEVSGAFNGSFSDSRGTFVKVYNIGEGTASTKQYLTATTIKCTYNGNPASLTNIQPGDPITLKLAGDIIVEVVAKPRGYTITGAVLDEMIVEPAVAIKITHATSAYNGMVIPVSSEMYVSRNGKVSSLQELIPGDKIDVKVDYDKVIEISATSVKRTSEGSITAINIGTNDTSYIKLQTSDGQSNTYTVLRSTVIKLDNNVATIYDLRLGFNVKISVESDAVTSITVTSVTPPTTLSGTVELINVSLGFMNISVIDPVSGEARSQQVFVKKDISIIDSATASKHAFKDIKIGDIVMVTGKVNIGAFEASAIIIVSK